MNMHEGELTLSPEMIRALRQFSTIPAAKALLEEMGFPAGNATFPMKQLDEQQRREVVAVMRKAGWTDGEFTL